MNGSALAGTAAFLWSGSAEAKPFAPKDLLVRKKP